MLLLDAWAAMCCQDRGQPYAFPKFALGWPEKLQGCLQVRAEAPNLKW